MDNGYVEANGQKLYYEVHGEGEPLILIMGLGADATLWVFQIGEKAQMAELKRLYDLDLPANLPILSEHFKVIVFDNRDVGRSSLARGPYSIADMAEDAAGLMDALGIEQAHVLGASMGGLIAQELVLSHPDKVCKLVLCETTARAGGLLPYTLKFWRWLKQHDPDNEFFPIELAMAGRAPDFLKDSGVVKQMIELGRNPQFPVPPEAYLRQLDATSAFDAFDRLGAIKVPTLVLVGDRDILTPPWMSREIAEAISGAKLQILEGGAHGFLVEIPHKVNQAVIDFLIA